MSFWNKKIFDFVGTASGLDIGDLCIRIVQIEKEGKKDRLIGYGSIPLEKGSVSDGEIEDENQVVEKLKSLQRSTKLGKLKSKKVICSLPETKAFLRIISMPKLEKKEIKEAIKWEIEANIPLTLDQVYYDWQVLDENIAGEKGKTSILVVAVARNTVDKFISVIEKAGLEPVGFEVESIAQARSLINIEWEKKTVLIVDIDDRSTGILVSSKGIPCFTSSVPVSGQSITSAISKGLNVTFDEAEKIKNENGIGSDFKNNNIFNSVNSVLENLSSEIERSINFYVSELSYSEDIDKIIICGKEATMKGLVPYLAKRLQKKVELGNPWVNLFLGKNIPKIDRGESVRYSTVIGLAIKGINYEDIIRSSS